MIIIIYLLAEKFRFSAEFIEMRRQALDVFVNRIASHHELRQSDDLRIFLQADEQVIKVSLLCWIEFICYLTFCGGILICLVSVILIVSKPHHWTSLVFILYWFCGLFNLCYLTLNTRHWGINYCNSLFLLTNWALSLKNLGAIQFIE